jgi:hypothetical protein
MDGTEQKENISKHSEVVKGWFRERVASRSTSIIPKNDYTTRHAKINPGQARAVRQRGSK